MSFVDQGRPDGDDKEEIMSSLLDSAEDAFGREFEEEEAIVLTAFYDPVAEYFAGQQEDMAEVLNSAQIDYAEGQALDFLAELIGVQRREATASTTQLQFQRDSRPTREYTIPSGTSAQTDSSDTLSFETDSSAPLSLLDSFEDGDIDEYNGDTGSFSVAAGSTVDSGNKPTDGDNLLTSGSSGVIINTSEEIGSGSVIVYNQMVPSTSTSSAGFLFGVQDSDNHYRVLFDESAGEVSIDLIESGSVSDNIATASATINDDTTYRVEVDWTSGGDITAVVEEVAPGSGELVEVVGDEVEPTFETGGYGFENVNGGDSYWDFVAPTAISTSATASTSGSDTNASTGTVSVLSSAVNGVDEVTNPVPATGGLDREPDDNYRIRAKEELSTALRATLPALINRLTALQGTRSVTVIDNDENTTDEGGRPGHSFEAIVETNEDSYNSVAETILNTKAAGDTSVGGHAGTSITRSIELSNGQMKDITFSVPTSIEIYIELEINTNDDYIGDNDVEDALVQYIGGQLNSGDNVGGELRAGGDVIYNKLIGSVVGVEGVTDVDNLTVGTSSSPNGESNVTIADSESAVISDPDVNIELVVN